MALSKRLDAISMGPKKSRFPGPNPLPRALVMDLPALHLGPYKAGVKIAKIGGSPDKYNLYLQRSQMTCRTQTQTSQGDPNKLHNRLNEGHTLNSAFNF
jgi:hypothetical protein